MLELNCIYLISLNNLKHSMLDVQVCSNCPETTWGERALSPNSPNFMFEIPKEAKFYVQNSIRKIKRTTSISTMKLPTSNIYYKTTHKDIIIRIIYSRSIHLRVFIYRFLYYISFVLLLSDHARFRWWLAVRGLRLSFPII